MPPTTLDGLRVKEETEGGRIVTVADWLLELKEAVMLDEELAPTGDVETVNVALDDPAPTVTLVETVAMEELLEDRLTTAPPDSAGPLRVTVA